jgi:hypothetical protein
MEPDDAGRHIGQASRNEVCPDFGDSQSAALRKPATGMIGQTGLIIKRLSAMEM